MSKQFGDSLADYVDPAWDYATIFKLLLEFKDEVESTIEIIGNQEIATVETDTNLKVGVECLVKSLLEIQAKLK